MKYFLSLICIFNIALLTFIPNIQAQDNEIPEQQDTITEDILDRDQVKDSSEKSEHHFSSLKVDMKKKKESLSFNKEPMKITLKYIENK